MTIDPADFSVGLSQDVKELLNVGPNELESILKLNHLTLKALNDMVTSVREWIIKQPHLPNDKIRDRQIIGVLIFQCFSVEKVKRGIDDYLTARARLPDVLCDRDPLDPIQEQYFKQGHLIIMPKKTPDDHRVVIFRMMPTENSSVSTILKIAFMTAEYRIWNDVSRGDRWLFDLKHVGFHETMQFTPVMMSNIIFLISTCLGAKLKSIHVINMPPAAAVLVNIFKKMMKSKLADRVFVTNKDDILNIFPKECLPAEYEGEGGNCQDIADKWTKTMQSGAWRQYFLEQNSVIPDESKKLTQSCTDEIFGVEGSFRKICLD